MAVSQSGGVDAVSKLMTKLAGSAASCDFASLGRTGLSSETTEENEGPLTSVET